MAKSKSTGGWLAIAIACTSVCGCQRAPRELETDRATATTAAAPEAASPVPVVEAAQPEPTPTAEPPVAEQEPAPAAPEATQFEPKAAPKHVAPRTQATPRKSSALAKLASAQRPHRSARDVSQANAESEASAVSDFGGRR